MSDVLPAAMPISRKVLCGVYALIALGALVATWSQNLAYSDDLPHLLSTFWTETKVNPASRSITADILLLSLAGTIWMVIEARKHQVKFVWLYVVGAFFIAISVTFPLFLIAREVKLAESDAERLRPLDIALLALLAVGTAVFVLWVDIW